MQSKIWVFALLIFLFHTNVSWAKAAETKPEAKPEMKTEAKPEAKSEAKTEAKQEAKPEAKIKTVYKTPKRTQIVGFDANGNPAYFGESFPSRQASLDELKTSLLNNLVNVSRTVCDLSIRPESVTTLVGTVSLTWETDKLCKTVKSEKLK
jgi:hypothetical protein